MANFILIRGKSKNCTEKTVEHYFNVDLITDFRYIPEKDFTQVGFEGEEEYRTFDGNITNQLLKQKPIYALEDRQNPFQPLPASSWIHCEGKSNLWYCSNCGEKIIYNPTRKTYKHDKQDVSEVNRFCRHCGAKMQKEET